MVLTEPSYSRGSGPSKTVLESSKLESSFSFQSSYVPPTFSSPTQHTAFSFGSPTSSTTNSDAPLAVFQFGKSTPPPDK